ncbi:cellulase family glycosylhydrolase [Aquimarina sp. AU474]|uniref:cellulase family glycosylhydrolase n=1 Tax=Aquimarina sp. AU474 TaxID=2108529 RepID=UPI000D6990AA|nr:cellulase family glycosylhydrolase [Aquimarina sp. AU474]
MKSKIIYIKRILILILVMLSFTNLSAQQQNFLSVSGNKLFDTTGKEVRLTGVNWFGFETSLYSPHGLWARDMKSVLQQIKDLGFNTIRVPWCNEMLNPGATINIASFGSDPYTGISPMNEEESKINKPIELMDILVQWCQENDIKIILDNHSRAADGFLNEAFWYTDQYSEERWISDWVFMANRYKNFSTVVGMDLNNEPHGSSWGNSNPATDWNKAAERCGNAVLEVNPNVLIVVEGVGEFEGDSYWWGGQLMGAEKYPVQLSSPDKLMYSAHEYGPEVAPQDWFTAANFPQNMSQIWKDHFHYLYENNTSPLFIGEFGIKDQDAFGGTALTWFTEWVDFMGDIYSWTFWTMNPNSGDTGGILADDWSTVNQWKMDILKTHFAPLIPNVVGGNGNRPPIAGFTTNISSGDAPLTIQFDGSSSTDPDNDNLSYSWDFGDGTTTTGVDTSHLFDQPGVYQVALTVNDGSLNDTEIKTITVNDPDNTVIVTANISPSDFDGVAPITISFDGSGSSSSDGSTLSYTWDFGGGTNGNGVNVVHEYTNAGNYTVNLTVTNQNSVSDTAIVNITITESIEADLVLEYKDGGQGNATDNMINPHFRIVNNGNQAVDYQDITIRYWFSSEENNTLNFWCDWAQLGTSFVNGTFSTLNGIDYLEMSFDTAAGSIAASNNSGPIQARFAKANWTPFDENNDYSYDNSKMSFMSHDRVTLYLNGSLVWGIEPSGNQLVNPSNELKFITSPNPVTNIINVSSNQSLENTRIRFMDLTGNSIQLKHIKEKQNSTSFSVEGIPSGLYIMEVMNFTTNKKIRKKIVINK